MGCLFFALSENYSLDGFVFAPGSSRVFCLLHFSYLSGGGVAKFPFVRPFCGAGPGGAGCVADCLLPVFSGAVYSRG